MTPRKLFGREGRILDENGYEVDRPLALQLWEDGKLDDWNLEFLQLVDPAYAQALPKKQKPGPAAPH